MTWHKVKFSCGHEDRVNILGIKKERIQRISFLEKQGLCPVCYKLHQVENSDKYNSSFLDEKDIKTMPELKGTPKQITWAQSQRLKRAREIHEALDAEIKGFVSLPTELRRKKQDNYNQKVDDILRFKEYILSHTLASWWINQKDEPYAKLVQDWRDEGEPELSDF